VNFFSCSSDPLQGTSYKRWTWYYTVMAERDNNYLFQQVVNHDGSDKSESCRYLNIMRSSILIVQKNYCRNVNSKRLQTVLGLVSDSKNDQQIRMGSRSLWHSVAAWPGRRNGDRRLDPLKMYRTNMFKTSRLPIIVYLNRGTFFLFNWPSNLVAHCI